MPFERKIDASYPCIYNTWKTDDATMIIQDLPPEDIEAALKILKDDMLADEVLCRIQKIIEDPLSVHESIEYWRECLKERTSIGCYEEKDGKKTLVALNVCIVGCEGDDHKHDFKTEQFKNLYAVFEFAEKIASAYEYTGFQTLLNAAGLIVKKEYRGRRLGQKILAAREPLCLSQGIKGTATVFTGIASQIPAMKCGFETIAEFPIRQMAEKGLPYPKDDERLVKYMVKKNMPFERKIDASYPCIYNTWKTDDATMIIQDLPPEDDEAALKILKDGLLTDEVLCKIQKVIEDPVSVNESVEFWRECLKERTSIGCYEEKDGKKTLVALNCCIVGCEGDDHKYDFKGDKWKNVYDVIDFAEEIANSYEHTGLQTLLHAVGLVVKKEYRGRQLGQKILAAREPLCLSQGIKGTATVFTGIASQIPAMKCGFETIAEFPIRQMAEKGLPYPKDDERLVKYMVKKYV